jgi:acyl-CoA reductase-like NAD-dependent aldehyde dehydrogenase
LPSERSFFAPTVLADVAHDSDTARKEIFGPVVAVLGVLAHERLGLGINALAHIARTSIIASACPDDRRAAALNRLDTWTAAHGPA